MVWSVFLCLTLVALAVALWPMVRPVRPRAAQQLEADFYRGQIAAIERDLRDGVIAPADAQAARAEAGRRAIAGAVAQPVGPVSPHVAWIVAGLLLFVVPAASIGLYRFTGRPDLPDAPLAQRLAAADAGMKIDVMVQRLEAHLKGHPEDGRAYELIAPVYLQLDRVDDSVQAYRAALRLLGETAPRRASFAEALVAQAGGVVNAEASASFEQAIKADPSLAKANFYLGVAAEQGGDKTKALEIWNKMLSEAAPDAIWVPIVEGRIARLTGVAVPHPAASQAQEIAALPEKDRNAMIRSMVDGLASRLAQNGQDVEGWLRLIRSLSVLNETARAKTALQDARQSLAADAPALARINAMARELGIDGG